MESNSSNNNSAFSIIKKIKKTSKKERNRTGRVGFGDDANGMRLFSREKEMGWDSMCAWVGFWFVHTAKNRETKKQTRLSRKRQHRVK